MVTVNGQQFDVAGQTLSQYLATTDYNPQRIAIELNGDIVLKSQYEQTVLSEGDSMEVVTFVGGG